MPKTETERTEFLSSLNLNPDPKAPALERFDRSTFVELAPEGIDPHMMAVTDIVFTTEMVEQFPDLSPRSRRAASDHLFALYKSYGRNRDRNSLLHRRIGEFLAHTHRERETGGSFVKDKIRLANTLAEHDVTAEDLAEFLAQRKAKK